MSAERIAVAGATAVFEAPMSPVYNMGDGSFLDAIQLASAAVVAPPAQPSHTTVKQPPTSKHETQEEFHSNDEKEDWNPPQESIFFGENGFDFGDLLDVINPLQHLPIISSIYRTLTGDEISPASRLAGGALFGGPIGFASAFATGVIEDATDTTIGDVIVSAFTGEDETDNATQLAAIAPAGGTNTGGGTDTRPITTAGATAALMPQATPAPTTVTINPAPSEPRTTLQPHAIMAAFEKPKPSPLAFARELVESPKAGIIAPSANATKSVIAADEAMRAKPDMPDPVAAVLAARSQVPRRSSVSGLSAYRKAPVMNATAESAALTQKATPQSRITQLEGPANAARDAAPAYEPGKRGAPPPRTNFVAQGGGRRRAAAAAAVPTSMVPNAMMSALDKYESMLLNRRQPDSDDLTM